MTTGGSSDPLRDAVRTEAEDVPALRCVSHRGVETYLRCGKCGEPICARCVVLTPVGARCRRCANPRRLPTFEVPPTFYLRATAAALGVAVVGGVLAGLLRGVVPLAGLLLPLALGYLVGEAVSLSVNRKRGTGLKVIAGTGVVAAFVVPQILLAFLLRPAALAAPGLAQASAMSLLGLLANPIGLLVLALGVVVAISRL